MQHFFAHQERKGQELLPARRTLCITPQFGPTDRDDLQCCYMCACNPTVNTRLTFYKQASARGASRLQGGSVVCMLLLLCCCCFPGSTQHRERQRQKDQVRVFLQNSSMVHRPTPLSQCLGAKHSILDKKKQEGMFTEKPFI
jgi:hypothetical protein